MGSDGTVLIFYYSDVQLFEFTKSHCFFAKNNACLNKSMLWCVNYIPPKGILKIPLYTLLEWRNFKRLDQTEYGWGCQSTKTLIHDWQEHEMAQFQKIIQFLGKLTHSYIWPTMMQESRQKHMQNIHSTCICNEWKLDVSQVSINGWMENNLWSKHTGNYSEMKRMN